MLEGLRKRGRAGKSGDEQLTELDSLINKAREERAALSTMLSQVEVRGRQDVLAPGDQGGPEGNRAGDWSNGQVRPGRDAPGGVGGAHPETGTDRCADPRPLGVGRPSGAECPEAARAGW